MLAEIRDSLDLDADEAESRDLVIGNPPYGGSRYRRNGATIRGSVYGHANLYGVFTDAALYWVKRGAVVGFVTPTSMLSGLYYKALRALLAAEAPPLSVNFVSERDGVFADVLQETMLATYRKGGVPVAGKVGFIDVAGDKIVSRRAGRFSLPARPALRGFFRAPPSKRGSRDGCDRWHIASPTMGTGYRRAAGVESLQGPVSE